MRSHYNTVNFLVLDRVTTAPDCTIVCLYACFITKSFLTNLRVSPRPDLPTMFGPCQSSCVQSDQSLRRSAAPLATCNFLHDDVIKRKHFPRYWPFVRGIHRSPVKSQHKGKWHGALMFSLIWAWTNGSVNIRKADDLRHNRAHYDVIVMLVATVHARSVPTATSWVPEPLCYRLTLAFTVTSVCELIIIYYCVHLLVVTQLCSPSCWHLNSKYCGARCRQSRLMLVLSPLISLLHLLVMFQSDMPCSHWFGHLNMLITKNKSQ